MKISRLTLIFAAIASAIATYAQPTPTQYVRSSVASNVLQTPIVGSTTAPIYNAPVVSIAALRTLNVTTPALANGVSVQVQGYYAANDGGGGVYVWNSASTATDNGGTVIQATGVATGRWLLYYTTQLSARQFGAKGDGTTDDSAAINAAVGALPSTGGVVWLTPGTYNVGSTITLKQNATLAGTSPLNSPTSFPVANAGAVLSASFAGKVISYSYSSPEDGNVGVQDIGIDGTSMATIGIYFGNFRGVRVDRVAIKNVLTYGIQFDLPSFGASYTAHADDVYTNMGASTTTIGILVSAPLVVINRSVSDGAGYGIVLAGNTGTVTNSHLEGAGVAGIEIRSGSNVVSGNRITMTATGNINQIGISVTNSASNAVNLIEGNTMTGTTATIQSAGIFIQGSSTAKTNVVGNYISAFNVGIDNRGVDGIVSSNVIDGATTGITNYADNNTIVGGYVALASGTDAIHNYGSASTSTVRAVSTAGLYTGITPQDVTTGTWTPVIAGTTTPGTNTYSEQFGTYTKIGRLVFIQGTVKLSALDGAAAGNVSITGLPFSSNSGADHAFGLSLAEWGITTFTNKMLALEIPPSNQIIYVFDSGATSSFMPISELGNTSYFIFSGCYQTNDP